MMDLAEVVTLLKAEAAKLREAGVLTLKLGELEVTFAAAMGEMPADFKDDEDDKPSNTFLDPATYGLPPDAEVPGFSRPGSLTDEDMEQRRDR